MNVLIILSTIIIGILKISSLTIDREFCRLDHRVCESYEARVLVFQYMLQTNNDNFKIRNLYKKL